MTNTHQQAPDFQPIDEIEFLPAKEQQLDNNIPVSIIRAGSQEVTKIDMTFPAGAVQAGIPLVASTTANLLQAGTNEKTSSEISELIDYHGAYLSTQTYHHHTVLTLLCLSKHLPRMLNLMDEIISRPSFPEHEYDIFLQKKHEEFLFDSEKIRFMANQRFGEIIFGPDHPYGRQLKQEHFEKISREQVKTFHRDHYHPAFSHIYVAGQPGENILNLLNEHFGQRKRPGKKPSEEIIPNPVTSEEQFTVIPKEGAMQSALRIGKPLFNNHHPDYIPLQVLNTVLGGYFGSRLMTTVREKKGLTYGIGSSIMPLRHGGIWGISSEVSGESRDQAIEAIFEEFEILRQQLVPEDELKMVKNYMMGELLRNFDGPFTTADIYRTLREYELDYKFYQNMIATIKNIRPEDIRETARQYLDPATFKIVSAGA
ncbi:MAG: M16 family metallopeptidase [Marinilabiliaceae bacterium]